MKRLLLSLTIVLGLASLTFGVTRAIFSSQAVKGINTFSTGTLEIRLNGESTLTGFTFSPAAPGDCATGQFGVNNFGAPYFAGPSNLTAKELVISAVYVGGDAGLFNTLTVDIEANRGWPTWMNVFEGNLNALNQKDLLTPNWTELIPGSSEDVKYSVCLPANASSGLQGKTTEFNFVVNAYNPHR